MTPLRSFARFWWDFLVGDDWRVACGVSIALLVVGVAAHHGRDVWWLLPPVVAGILAASLRRATTLRRDRS
jgi:hypothetical protein